MVRMKMRREHIKLSLSLENLIMQYSTMWHSIITILFRIHVVINYHSKSITKKSKTTMKNINQLHNQNISLYYINPLAELNKRIFKSANRFVVNVVYILKDCKCTNFPRNSGKQSFCLFCVISDYHKLIAELCKKRFNPFPCFSKWTKYRFPIFLIRPIWNFQLDISFFKSIKLYGGSNISTITDDGAILKVTLYVFQIMNVVNTRLCQVKRVYDTAQPTERM